jgi:hypothetical protein
MKRHIAVILTTLALMACGSKKTKHSASEEPRSPASEVGVKIVGLKAFELLRLINKVDAVNFNTSECSNGKCFEEGSITLLCVTANNGNPYSRANKNHATNSCDVKANKLNGNQAKLHRHQAADLAILAESTGGLGKKEDAVHSCNPTHCLTKGILNIACKYPDGNNTERDTACNVSSSPLPKETN